MPIATYIFVLALLLCVEYVKKLAVEANARCEALLRELAEANADDADQELTHRQRVLKSDCDNIAVKSFQIWVELNHARGKSQEMQREIFRLEGRNYGLDKQSKSDLKFMKKQEENLAKVTDASGIARLNFTKCFENRTEIKNAARLNNERHHDAENANIDKWKKNKLEAENAVLTAASPTSEAPLNSFETESLQQSLDLEQSDSDGNQELDGYESSVDESSREIRTMLTARNGEEEQLNA